MNFEAVQIFFLSEVFVAVTIFVAFKSSLITALAGAHFWRTFPIKKTVPWSMTFP